MLGGCSAMNYMLYVRGCRDDYDIWQEMGCTGWSWRHVVNYFKKSEGVQAPIPLSSYRNSDGPMPVSIRQPCHSWAHAFVSAATHIGLPVNPDYNGESLVGAALSQCTIDNGERVTTGKAFLGPAITRPNFTVAIGCQATRVAFNESREAIGVRFKRHGGLFAGNIKTQAESMVKCKREVIICGGAVNSPHILMHSGIGPAEELKKFGIPVVADVPGVGKNLQDHLFVPLLMESKIPTQGEKDDNLLNQLKWLRSGEGPANCNVVEAMAFARTGQRPGFRPVDLQFHLIQGTPMKQHFDNFNFKHEIREKIWSKRPDHTVAIFPTLLHPQSIGSITLGSRDPLDAPIIDANYLSHPGDVKLLVEGCKLALQMFNSPAMRPNIGRSLLDDTVTNNPHDEKTNPDAYYEW
jgi:choline dehydrogenase